MKKALNDLLRDFVSEPIYYLILGILYLVVGIVLGVITGVFCGALIVRAIENPTANSWDLIMVPIILVLILRFAAVISEEGGGRSYSSSFTVWR